MDIRERMKIIFVTRYTGPFKTAPRHRKVISILLIVSLVLCLIDVTAIAVLYSKTAADIILITNWCLFATSALCFFALMIALVITSGQVMRLTWRYMRSSRIRHRRMQILLILAFTVSFTAYTLYYIATVAT